MTRIPKAGEGHQHDWNAWTGKCNRCGHLLPYPSEIGPDWQPDRPCTRIPKAGEVHEFRRPAVLYCVDCGQAERHAVHGWRWDPDAGDHGEWIEPAWWPPAEPLAVRSSDDEGQAARVVEGELACRTDGDGRRYVAGIVVPYGRRSEPVRIAGRLMHEMFAARAAHVDPARGMVLRSGHPRPGMTDSQRNDTLIGRAVEHEQRDEGLWAEFRLSRRAAAQELWGMADDGTLTSLSVEFSEATRSGYKYRDLPAPSKDELPLRIISHARVRGAALVDHGAYADAAVTAVRSAPLDLGPWIAMSDGDGRPLLTADQVRAWQPGARLGALRRRIDILERTAP